MIRIVLDDEQIEKLSNPDEPIELVDRHGRRVRSLSPAATSPIDDAYLDEIERRMENDNGDRYTTQEVLDHLQSQDVNAGSSPKLVGEAT